MSLHAISGTKCSQAMLLQAVVNNWLMWVYVDLERTQFHLQNEPYQKLGITIGEQPRLQVVVANKEKVLSCDITSWCWDFFFFFF